MYYIPVKNNDSSETQHNNNATDTASSTTSRDSKSSNVFWHAVDSILLTLFYVLNVYSYKKGASRPSTQAHASRSSTQAQVDLSHLSDEESEEDKKCCTGAPKLISVDPEYEDDGSNSVPGDLVISSPRDAKHPARRDTNFGNCYLILGAVIGFKGVPMEVIEA